MSRPPGLARAAAAGASWNLAALVAGRLLTLASTAVLARVLEPEEFGLMALGLLVISLGDAVNDFGLDEAVVVKGGRDPDRVADVAFVLTVAIGALFAAATVVGAPVLAGILGDDRATQVIRALAVVFLLVSLGQIQRGMLDRQLLFRRRVAGELALGAVKAGVSVGLALAGLGVWALVWGQVAGTLARVATNWAVCPWRPSLRFDRGVARSLAGFGGPLSVARVLGAAAASIDVFAIGRRLGAAPLGVYSLAYRLPELLIVQTTQAVTATLVPTYALATVERERLARGFYDSTRMVASVAVPLGVGLAVLAPETIRVLYGSRWLDAVPVLRLLGLASVVVALSYPAGAAVKAVGRTGVLAGVAALRLLTAVPLVWYSAGHGIDAVACAQLAATVPPSVLLLVVAARSVGAGARAPFRAVAPVIAAGVVMAGVAGIVRAGAGLLGPVAAPALGLATGLLAYTATLQLLVGPWYRRAFATITGRRRPDVEVAER